MKATVTRRHAWFWLLLMALLSPVLALLFGAADMPPSSLLRCVLDECASPIDTLIFHDIRLPRVLAGFLVGAGLAIAGAALQNVTRNGLADPYLFGVVAGAGLGASVVTIVFEPQTAQALGVEPLVLLLQSLMPDAMVLPVAAFAGALLAVVMVQGLALSDFARSSEQLLLAGVAISLMLGAITHFILYLGEPFAANKVMFWLMGSLTRVEMSHLWLLLPVVVVSTALLWFLGPRFDAMLLGDDNARTLGVEASHMRMLAMVVCAALTAVIVAHCGGIGFVGLMIPHMVRAHLGVTTRTLVLGCLLCGGSFLVWVDVLARAAVSDQEIPIGIITSAIGSVFFLLVMRQRS